MSRFGTPEDDIAAYVGARLVGRLGRRGLLRALAAVGTAAAAAVPLAGQAAAGAAAPASRVRLPGRVLQPGTGPIDGRHYLRSDPDQVLWGYLPRVGDEPVLRMRSGETVTIDTVSHEGILEDQGRDPVAYFASKGVRRRDVLDDAVAIAGGYDRTPRDFDVDGPHVVTGPVFVEGAEPGDVLKVETLSALPRVPYGVVSSRHGKGALSAAFADLARSEVMPPVETDGRATGDPERYGNVSTFTPVTTRRGRAVGRLPVGRTGEVTFPIEPFAGLMGVATTGATSATDPSVNSIPPTRGGGNIDINLLGVDSAFYLPVVAEGALFHVGDPHFAMGDGEVALTALEGSLRLTFRLTVCKRGDGRAPGVAFGYPFAETPEAWVPIGLSDPDGAIGGQVSDLDVAMRRAVVNALDFLQDDLGMDRPTAYAYLSAGADFAVSQVVDRTVGVHGIIRKEHFRGRA
ncbi:acetamidase/formamidase family protein [Jiangella anatolica]|uniref:Acetamidase n=1 Tax=Jiangella anatolica TaxID=2670374 RepID=A0A2W2BTG5_9ACTN|nr:acetamidase/formamidase family protein [Jiangella anatolica]PZF83724.1 acetamidase [Jiangella anatolica]